MLKMSSSSRTYWKILVLAVFWLAMGTPGWGAATTLKVALVTPEGSTWTRIMKQMAREVSTQSQGQIKFKIYAGGVSGDERAVMRKMRVGLIQMAGFSGIGLGDILPEVRILEAPLLFRSGAEIDWIKSRLFDRFAAAFDAKGYVLLGFAEAGFVYFFSRPEFSVDSGLAGLKMWAWKGDPVAKRFLDSFGVSAVPLHVMDVNTGLETGMIEAFYAPPLAAVAFQWYAKVRFYLDYPMVNSTGALLIRKSAFTKLTPPMQKLLKEKARQHCRKLVAGSRKENHEALELIQSAGIKAVVPNNRQIEDFQTYAADVYQKSIPGLFSQALFDEVQQLLETYRQQKPAPLKP